MAFIFNSTMEIATAWPAPTVLSPPVRRGEKAQWGPILIRINSNTKEKTTMKTPEPKWTDANTTHESVFRDARTLTEWQLHLLVMKGYVRLRLVNGCECRIPNEDIEALPPWNIAEGDEDGPFLK